MQHFFKTTPKTQDISQKKFHWPQFPIFLKDLLYFINERYPNYTIDTNNQDFLVKDRNTHFYLLCPKHGNKIFQTKWRYININANLKGMCYVCRAEEQQKKKSSMHIKITKYVAIAMQKHKRHPVELIDKRYKEYDLIPNKEKVSIKCLECGWDKDKVSLQNFFISEKHTDKTYRCQGCVHIGKYGDTIPVQKLKPLLKDKELTLSNKLSDGEKIFIVQCDKCAHRTEYKKLSQVKMILKRKDPCSKCSMIKYYNEEYNRIAKKGYLLTTPIEQFQCLKVKGQYIIYDFICKAKKHTLQRSLNNFTKTNGCKECIREDKQTKDFQEFSELVAEKGGSVIENQTLKTRSDKLQCLCTYGHKFHISFSKLKKNVWCRTCTVGVGERITRIILEHLLDLPNGLPNRRPDFLKNPATNANLELDGYNAQNAISFEYAIEGDFYHRDPKKIQYDRLKEKLCKEASVTLIKIPEFKNYAHTQKNIQSIVSILERMGITIKNRDLQIDFKSAYLGTETLKKFTQILKDNNATLLNEFQGLHSRIHIKS